VAGRRWTLGDVASVALVVMTMVASFFLAVEDSYPGRYFIERQALWNGGTYGIKFTFLLTWFTLLAAVGLPSVMLLGTAALLRRLTARTAAAPPGWDVQQLTSRLLTAVAALALFFVWVAVTGLVSFAPDVLAPLGGFASILLLVVPLLPVVPGLLFEALIPTSYVEGPVEGMQFRTHQQRDHLVSLRGRTALCDEPEPRRGARPRPGCARGAARDRISQKGAAHRPRRLSASRRYAGYWRA